MYVEEQPFHEPMTGLGVVDWAGHEVWERRTFPSMDGGLHIRASEGLESLCQGSRSSAKGDLLTAHTHQLILDLS